MARPLRFESEGGVYHVLNRGNYRADIFRSDKAKAAFPKCLGDRNGVTSGIRNFVHESEWTTERRYLSLPAATAP